MRCTVLSLLLGSGVLLAGAAVCGEDAGKMAEQRKEIPTFKPATEAMASTLALRLRFLKERCGPNERDRGRIDAAQKDLAALEKDLELLTQGRSILTPDRELLMGYRSELDDSDQPYSLWIPREYDGTTQFPLAVLLHGQGMFNPLQCRASPIGKMLVVAPQGRGGMDYMYVGEGDVLRVIEEVQTLLNVDPNRVYLAGASMGGAGSWHLASHFPDRFAGIMALCGNTDINVWQELWYWRTPQDSPIAKVRHFLREDTCAITYAPNLRNVSILALQGEADPIVNQLHARHMLDALKANGHPNYTVHMLPYVTHGFGVNYELGLKPFVRDPRPKEVHYKTAWLRYPGAYWLTIKSIEKRLKHATIDGIADPEKKSIEIKTNNVMELAIERSRLPFDGSPSRIALDGTEVDAAKALRGDGGEATYCFRREKDAWQPAPRPLAEAYPPRKSAALEGPVEHAFMSRFVVIPGNGTPGTEPDPLCAAIEQAGNELGDQWKARFAVPCRKKPAIDITDADIADSNLILIGGPEHNTVTAHVIGKLPLVLEKDAVTLTGSGTAGGKKYTGPNVGAIMCYPNPLNPQRYVVIMYGTTPQAYTEINLRFGNWFDWVGYDYRKHYDFAVFDDLTNGHSPESFLVWGFFDEQWKMSPELTFEAVPAWRGKLRPRVLPTINLAELAKNKEKLPETLYLDEAFARNVNVYKEYLERNRTLDGNTLQLRGQDYRRGLCCRFPCSIAFDCAGYTRLKLAAGVAWDGTTEPCEDRKTFEKVKVTIAADGKTLFEANERTYKDEPCEIDVELNGAKTITLSANGGLPWLNGSFIWADARLEGLEPSKEKAKKGKKR
ncbi:MAG: NPCBM/NEW2 domain-containing protein [Planctomycetota bacterium]|nr:NPCBM/NEW2 domain-containing protein [Planctomycetota bacterium]